jgi:hypothetical protein
MSSSLSFPRSLHSRFQKSSALLLAIAVLGASGCSSGVAPTKTASGATTGATIGGLGGAVVGANSGMGTTTGLLGGVAAGAIVGGLVGLVQDAKEKKEQDRLAQERAYSKDLADRRKADALRRATNEEELKISQGFRISDLELAEQQKKLDDATSRLKRLEEERSTALKKKTTLDETIERTLATEARIAAMEEELARLKGENPVAGNPEPAPADTASPARSAVNATPAR